MYSPHLGGPLPSKRREEDGLTPAVVFQLPLRACVLTLQLRERSLKIRFCILTMRSLSIVLETYTTNNREETVISAKLRLISWPLVAQAAETSLGTDHRVSSFCGRNPHSIKSRPALFGPTPLDLAAQAIHEIPEAHTRSPRLTILR